ncbi:DNA invertase Pin-like site-specific DNA recombinase [Pullulanibacillus pueri]|uniref:DNA recombinase n=1 Tax=Pullulanibacillus pueri TaxID=1437324 RepID=A0A8J2ZXG7_9BACL|nr:recombinase family protein [Pullulanibacillus pueri]MBM7683719.1 DNA invertase Pin-like site-specific DNA recombinase [Pullulanibacillus pueri]GGH85171.1 DNA recombinase [Pullulanibacillus pueri]
MGERKLGYIRVSSADQNIDRQLSEMKAQGLEDRDIFIDKVSGKDFIRDEYTIMKRVISEGDVLFVKSIDRFGRNSRDIKREWEDITQNIGADICVLDMPLLDTRQYRDTLGTFVSDLVLQVLAFVAQKEREDIRQRQAEGIAAAKAKGKRLGRPTVSVDTLSEEQRKVLAHNYSRWKGNDITSVEFMRLLELKKTTFYKIVNEYAERVGQ